VFEHELWKCKNGGSVINGNKGLQDAKVVKENGGEYVGNQQDKNVEFMVQRRRKQHRNDYNKPGNYVRPTLKESITWSKDMIHYFKEKWEVDRLKEIDTQEIEDVLEVNNGTTNIMMDNEISGIEGEVLNEDFYGL
nr:hypothetical protein [Tanacetum cinerariifolium]